MYYLSRKSTIVPPVRRCWLLYFMSNTSANIYLVAGLSFVRIMLRCSGCSARPRQLASKLVGSSCSRSSTFKSSIAQVVFTVTPMPSLVVLFASSANVKMVVVLLKFICQILFHPNPVLVWDLVIKSVLSHHSTQFSF